mmetsp:Transcript_16243/g.44981  ORF Transcript_16243/g.44981 Transcript_16243/m.44981 type:complete len:1127 (-) Transcript_16243:52-3432(-)
MPVDFYHTNQESKPSCSGISGEDKAAAVDSKHIDSVDADAHADAKENSDILCDDHVVDGRLSCQESTPTSSVLGGCISPSTPNGEGRRHETKPETQGQHASRGKDEASEFEVTTTGARKFGFTVTDSSTGDVNGLAKMNGLGIDAIEIGEVCSISYFRATPLNEFRQKLHGSLKSNLLSLSSLNSSASCVVNCASYCNGDNESLNKVVRYDPLKITRVLTNEIDWKALCEYHDKQYCKKQDPETSNTSTTALWEIATTMTNPMVLPRCCHGRCLIYVLLNALLLSPSFSVSLRRQRKQMDPQQTVSTTASRWTPSQRLLLEAIRSLLTAAGMSSSTTVSDSFMTNYVRGFVVKSSSVPSVDATASISNATTAVKTSRNATGITPNKVNRLLSVIYWLLNQSMSQSSPLLEMELISSGLLLLKQIDDWDIQLAVESEEQLTSARKKNLTRSDCCPVCNGVINGDETSSGNRGRRNKKMTIANLSNLHDEELELGKHTSQKLHKSNMFWRRGYDNKPKIVSLRDVLAMKQKSEPGIKLGGERLCRCPAVSGPLKRKRPGLTATTVISPDWSTVRSRAYNKFVSNAVERQRREQLRRTAPNTTQASLTREPTTPVSGEEFLWILARDAVVHATCPSRRVCLALLAHSLGGPRNPCYFQKIAAMFWRGYSSFMRQPKKVSVSASNWLRLYSEWLSECAAFDQRDVLWEAMKPIVEFITTHMRPNNDDGNGRRNDDIGQDARYDETEPNEDHEGGIEVDSAVLACLGCILHQRSHLFRMHRTRNEASNNLSRNSASNVEIAEEFQSFLNLLSVQCGESSEPWLDLFSDSTGNFVESTLQRLGILSFSVPVAGKKPNVTTSTIDDHIARHDSDIFLHSFESLATRDWPFFEEFAMRKAMGRIEKSVLCLKNESEGVMSLLTSPTTANKGPGQKPKDSKRLGARVPSVPMMDYLHDSGILCTIFSFCSSKQLAKVPQVCKTWKATIDMVSYSLWETAYVAQFGKYRWACMDAEHRHFVANGAITSVACEHKNRNLKALGTTYWKDMFIRKHIAEKLVRFQRNPRSGFKHRTCSYLGCLQVLKSVDQQRKHDQMHKRLLAKQQARLEKKMTTKRRNGAPKRKARDLPTAIENKI